MDPVTTTVALVDIGNAIAEQLRALARDPSPGKAADVACNLFGAHRAVLRLREAMTAEVHDVRE